jgi:hypothetical protein
VADKLKSEEKLFESVTAQRIQRFGQAGQKTRYVWMLNVTTVNGNSGTFQLEEADYLNDTVYTEKLLEMAFQLDKHLHTGGVM